jgi:hypothetical protein
LEKGQKELDDYEETDKKVIDLLDSLAARLKTTNTACASTQSGNAF